MRNNDYKIVKIDFDPEVWESYNYDFYLLDEEKCLRDKVNLAHFLGEDIMQFSNKINHYVIDVGVYGENIYNLPFVGYTIKIIQALNNDAADWQTILEKIIVKSSKELKQVVEDLLEKYSKLPLK